ncbi:MAG: xanthine dehydrogenase family protein molybdopterin-binding subunit [Reyranella sp.]|uniref:xanthine dehydrogenase family protein molybdopterin-binding subunit n=1 Tax=Reyranella sp. TaxID=1929291 RepID=UPI0012046441|nr:xanthine dehydrogenase family protein molybdopterin-binding subunit [Reyranella sp.]TAJ87960.1 MAG: xanthine dehydrogenase family protein molybdopterin-binding subunit [Reyranella sp.]
MTIERMGDSALRREDARFVTGHGAYLDDLKFDGVAQAVVLRSPHAHALIRSIDTTAARSAPGVLAVLTAADAAADGLKPLRPYAEANVQTGEPFAFAPQPLLASDKVRFAGEPVALIVAGTHAQALDAAELVVVDYQALPAVTSPEGARAHGAPQLAKEIPNNTCLDWHAGDTEGTDAAFARAAHVVSLDLDNHRIVMNPMEPRGGVGTFDPTTGRYTLHVSSQNIHINRTFVARSLGVEAKDVRFIAHDVGGGFGAKNFAYVEHALILWAARRIALPVKWIASRSEVFLSDHAARDMQAEASLALDANGKFLALRIASVANLGAYMAGAGGGVQTFQYIHLQGSVYRIPAIALHVVAVVTNTAPIGVTRGPGFAEAINIVERLIDAAAHRTGFDRADLRRWNMVPAEAMPMTNAFGFEVDSGRFAESLDHALARADRAGFDARRRESERRGRLRGLGFAYHIKATGGPPDENVDVRFEADGTVSLITGTQHIGQGHETTFPQILSTRLGIPNARIRLVQGDTDAIPFGGGHGSSRATYMGGTAIWRASDEIIAKGTALAADALEASVADIRFEDGRFVVSGTDRAIGLFDVAALGRERGRPLDTFHAWKREHMTFPNGAHVVEVEIDRDTGRVDLARYTAVDDYGVLVNPMIAAGQAHGAMAQGAGQALLEHATYDPESGQMVAGSFMDYALPRADDLPSFDLGFNPTRCTTNPLGVKGCGEAGAIAAFPAIANAILDALAPLGVKGFDGPASPLRIWQAIEEAR